MSLIQQKIIIMFIMMAVGFLCGKVKLITPEINKGLSNLSLLLINPLLSFVSYQTDYSPQIAVNLLHALILTLVSLAVMLTASVIIIRKSSAEYIIERLSLVLTNCGFMGIPLISSLYGNVGVIYLTAFITVFNIVVWTYGVITMTGSAVGIREIFRSLMSPAIIAVVLGVICFFLQLRLPETVLEPLTAIGNMNTPFAMLVAGATLSHTRLLSCLRRLRSYIICALRLVVLPCLVLLATFKSTVLGVDPVIINIVLVATACPTATVITMFAHRFNKNSVYASELFALSTLFSVVTIPFILWLASLLGL